MHYSKTNKVCATCAYWTGSRNLVNSGNSSEPTSNSAKCQIPKNLPVTGLMSLPGDGQMAILFPLVDTELLLQFLDKLLGLPCRNELERIYRVSQQQDFRRLQFPIS